MKIRILIFVGLLSMSGQASAGYLTASELLKECESTNVDDKNFCSAYLMGIVDATETYQDWGELKSTEFCIPTGVGMIQLRKTEYLPKVS